MEPYIAIQEDDVDIGELIRMAKMPGTGAVVLFDGVVRDDDIDRMDLEAYEPIARELMAGIARKGSEQYGLLSVAIVHRVGSLGLGVVVGVMGSRHPQARAFLGTGVLGGFTTFSAFAVQVVTSTPWLAVLLALCTLVLGVIAAGAGLRIGRALGHRRGSTDAPEQAE